MESKSFRQGIFARLLAAVLTTTQSLGAAPDPSVLCDRAAAAAAQSTGVPIDILLAITRVETGRGAKDTLKPWPWAINADGKGTFFDTRNQAIASATAHLTDGTGTFDVGCFQLNIRWHGDAFASLADMFDPETNALYAARFLTRLYQESGDWAKAVAAYHSRTQGLADQYLSQVKAVLDSSGIAPQPRPEPQRENLYPLLQAGGLTTAGSIVPLQLARGPIIGGNS